MRPGQYGLKRNDQKHGNDETGKPGLFCALRMCGVSEIGEVTARTQDDQSRNQCDKTHRAEHTHLVAEKLGQIFKIEQLPA